MSELQQRFRSIRRRVVVALHDERSFANTLVLRLGGTYPARVVLRLPDEGFPMFNALPKKHLLLVAALAVLMAVPASSVGASNSAFPRLVRCSLEQKNSTANPANSVIALDFSRPLQGDFVAGRVHIWSYNGSSFNPSEGRVEGTRLIVEVPALRAALSTICSVDFDAVRDRQGNENPQGRVGLSKVVRPGGRTDAPDLMSVGNLRAPLGTVLADFTFDEVAPVAPAASQLGLILTDGTKFAGAAITDADGNAYPGGAAAVFTVRFNATTQDLPFSQVARGTIQSAALTDASGNKNPLQAVPVSAVATIDPDLDSTSVARAEGQITYVFDESVSTTVLTSKFCFYTSTGEVPPCAGSAVRSATDPKAVIATFNTSLMDATGAFTMKGAVTAADSGPNSGQNHDDEAPLPSVVVPAGQTLLPDLTKVTRPADLVTQRTIVRFTWDVPITALSDGNAANGEVALEHFNLYGADGTRVIPSTDTQCTNGTGAAGSTNCIRRVAGDERSLDIYGFTNDQARQAVLATVNDTFGGSDGAGGQLSGSSGIYGESDYSFLKYSHGRSLSLVLGKHVVASGNLSVNDAVATCAWKMKVKIERRVAGQWKTVKTVLTNASGGFKTKLPDQIGSYRAVAPVAALQQEDVCKSATSATRSHSH